MVKMRGVTAFKLMVKLSPYLRSSCSLDYSVLNPLPRTTWMGKTFPLYNILISHDSQNKKFCTYGFEECMVTHEEWNMLD